MSDSLFDPENLPDPDDEGPPEYFRRGDESLFPPSMTLAEARVALGRLIDAGADCPICSQKVKLYPRKLISAAGRLMVLMLKNHGQDFVHVPTFAQNLLRDVSHQGGYLVIGHHWGLLVSDGDRKEHNGTRSGNWRLTDMGVEFLQRKIRMPKYAYIFDNRCIKLDGPPVSIDDVLGEEFRMDGI